MFRPQKGFVINGIDNKIINVSIPVNQACSSITGVIILVITLLFLVIALMNHSNNYCYQSRRLNDDNDYFLNPLTFKDGLLNFTYDIGDNPALVFNEEINGYEYRVFKVLTIS